MNEALNLNKNGLADEIDLQMEAFTHDLLPAIGIEDFIIDFSIDSNFANSIDLHWRWDSRKLERIYPFRYSVNETSDAFVHRVKSELFSILVMLTNL